jgi:hypothetical protein
MSVGTLTVVIFTSIGAAMALPIDSIVPASAAMAAVFRICISLSSLNRAF